MSTQSIKNLVDELAGLLEQLSERQQRLHAVIQGKLAAIRVMDTPAILAAPPQERRITDEINRLDARRRELVAEISRAVGVPGQISDGRVALRTLAKRLPETERQRLLARAERLKQRMLSVAEANRVVDMVCKQMLMHFKTLFAAMTRDDQPAGTYSASGRSDSAGHAQVLDAVG